MTLEEKVIKIVMEQLDVTKRRVRFGSFFY